MQFKDNHQFGTESGQAQTARHDAGLSGTISAAESLTPEFIARHSRFANAQEFIEATGFKVKSLKQLDTISVEKLDQFIRKETWFGSWHDMLAAASAEVIKKRLGR